MGWAAEEARRVRSSSRVVLLIARSADGAFFLPPRSDSSELVLASTKMGWPLKPTTVTAQADVDTFNAAFLSLLSLQLECVLVPLGAQVIVTDKTYVPL